MIKQRIEEIIIRGYCERDATDRKVFRYIAWTYQLILIVLNLKIALIFPFFWNNI
jgi:hypothetical protein